MKVEHEQLIKETAQDLAKGAPAPVDAIHRLLTAIYDTGEMVGVTRGMKVAMAMTSHPKT